MSAAFLSGFVVQFAFAWGVVYDPADVYQNTLTAVAQAKALLQSVQQTKAQIKLLQDEVNNSQNYAKGTWGQTLVQLTALANQISQGQSLAYTMSNLDSAFKQRYPGYQPSQDYNKAYQNWSQGTLDTLRGVLDSIHMQSLDFGNENNLMSQLKNLSSSAHGRMQALQAGNMISAQMVSQTEKLRQVVMAQTNAQNAYMAYQVQQDAARKATLSTWIHDSNSNFPHYQDKGFGPDNVPHPH
jgi:P-type conjugative transfer protein TrbJ